MALKAFGNVESCFYAGIGFQFYVNGCNNGSILIPLQYSINHYASMIQRFFCSSVYALMLNKKTPDNLFNYRCCFAQEMLVQKRLKVIHLVERLYFEYFSFV